MSKEVALFDWIQQFPDESIEKLRHINTSATSSKHVLLALAYGFCDVHIRRVNRVIISLMLRRMQAQRVGDSEIVQQLQSRLTDLHVAIDRATGASPPFSRTNRQVQELCNKARGFSEAAARSANTATI